MKIKSKSLYIFINSFRKKSMSMFFVNYCLTSLPYDIHHLLEVAFHHANEVFAMTKHVQVEFYPHF